MVFSLPPRNMLLAFLWLWELNLFGNDAGSKLVNHPKGELGAAVEVFPESRLRELHDPNHKI